MQSLIDEILPQVAGKLCTRIQWQSLKVFSFVNKLETKAGCTIAAASAPQREPEVGVSRVFIFAPIHLYKLI